jgi:hypothetical protein
MTLAMTKLKMRSLLARDSQAAILFIICCQSSCRLARSSSSHHITYCTLPLILYQQLAANQHRSHYSTISYCSIWTTLPRTGTCVCTPSIHPTHEPNPNFGVPSPSTFFHRHGDGHTTTKTTTKTTTTTIKTTTTRLGVSTESSTNSTHSIQLHHSLPT